MTFTIPFNPETLRKQAKINFQSVWNKSLWLYRIFLAITVFLFGYSLMYPGENGVSDADVFLVMMLTITIMSFGTYFRAKKQYNTAIHTSLNSPQAWTSNIVITITEEQVYYKTYNTEMTLQWNSFKRYRHIREVLFIDSKLGFALMIGEDEIPPEEFKALLKLVYKKLLSL